MYDRTKQIIQSYFVAVNRGDEAALAAIVADDFEFELMARSPSWMSRKMGKDAFIQTGAMLSQLMESPIQLEVVNIVVEGERASVEAVTDCKMRNGTRYDNAYHFAFELKNGKLKRLREYGCSHLAVKCFPELAPPGAM